MIDLKETLLIVLDTPDKKRIDGIEELEEYGCVVKIDHHPFVEEYANIEYIEGFSGHADQEWLMNFIYSFIKSAR